MVPTAPGNDATSGWTHEFWIAGTPSVKVNINNNLAYLESTRFLPNFDTSVVVPQSAIANEYTTFWTGRPNDIYDGDCDGNRGEWECGMGVAGAHDYIAPYPRWVTMWLYTGDWRMRQMSLGMAELAGAYPANLRESSPTRRLSRGDPTGLNPETGLGRVISITDRKTLDTNGSRMVSYGLPADNLTQVGAINWHGQPNWSFDTDHTPSPFFPPYILTGDPWYLGEMETWAAFAAAYPPSTGSAQARGPIGYYGGFYADVRGEGWTSRNRAETAFAAPDGTPEKAYFTYLTNDMLARWEGALGITGTPYDGTTEKVWGATVGDANSSNNGPVSGQPPPLHNWESTCNPISVCSDIAVLQSDNQVVSGAAGSYSAPWNQWYLQYALGRMAELGFAAQPLALWTGQYAITMINDSGLPILTTQYEMPTEQLGGGFFPTWAAVIKALTPGWVSGPCPTCVPAGGLPAYFISGLAADGRQTWLTPGLAMLVDQNAPGAPAAWGWWMANLYSS